MRLEAGEEYIGLWIQAALRLAGRVYEINEINVVEEMYQLLGETVVEVIFSVSGECVLFGKGVMIPH